MPLLTAFIGLASSAQQLFHFNSIPGHPLAATMNETLNALAEALSTMVSPLDTVGSSLGTVISGNDTGRTVPTSSSRACGAWNTGQHNLFQTAEVALILGSVVPHRFQMSTLIARGLLTVAFLLLAGWGTFVVCAWDIALWSLIHLLINGAYFAFLLWKNIPPPVDGELRLLYEKSFQPLLVEKRLFNRLVKHAAKLELEYGKRYSVEGITMADERVSILLSGRLQVTCEGVLLHYVQPTEFVDSPELESCPAGSEKTSQVTITAVEPSVYLCWTREAFASALRQNEFLDNVVFNLIGKDIAQKLYSLNEFHRLGGSGMSALCKDQADWWRSPIPRSVSLDALYTEARGRVRSLCWGKDITQDMRPASQAIPTEAVPRNDPASVETVARVYRSDPSGRYNIGYALEWAHPATIVMTSGQGARCRSGDEAR
ncbi:blood vessel epicardial substance-like [Tropilaelaps mercedesae]|uniref:Blood vessel epicardial substance-like n=1 Tax=Tropilaelaps mercedesae TaxID=418985 RepID=A0A1V9Y2M1_9ACAR|nr:blood vessel epicardial substance-like [Tropilaelaps mercedesae]